MDLTFFTYVQNRIVSLKIWKLNEKELNYINKH